MKEMSSSDHEERVPLVRVYEFSNYYCIRQRWRLDSIDISYANILKNSKSMDLQWHKQKVLRDGKVIQLGECIEEYPLVSLSLWWLSQ